MTLIARIPADKSGKFASHFLRRKRRLAFAEAPQLRIVGQTMKDQIFDRAVVHKMLFHDAVECIFIHMVIPDPLRIDDKNAGRRYRRPDRVSRPV